MARNPDMPSGRGGRWRRSRGWAKGTCGVRSPGSGRGWSRLPLCAAEARGAQELEEAGVRPGFLAPQRWGPRRSGDSPSLCKVAKANVRPGEGRSPGKQEELRCGFSDAGTSGAPEH